MHALVQVDQLHVPVAEDLTQEYAVDPGDDLMGVPAAHLDCDRVVLVAGREPGQKVLWKTIKGREKYRDYLIYDVIQLIISLSIVSVTLISLVEFLMKFISGSDTAYI